MYIGTSINESPVIAAQAGAAIKDGPFWPCPWTPTASRSSTRPALSPWAS